MDTENAELVMTGAREVRKIDKENAGLVMTQENRYRECWPSDFWDLAWKKNDERILETDPRRWRRPMLLLNFFFFSKWREDGDGGGNEVKEH